MSLRWVYVALRNTAVMCRKLDRLSSQAFSRFPCCGPVGRIGHTYSGYALMVGEVFPFPAGEEHLVLLIQAEVGAKARPLHPPGHLAGLCRH